MRHLYFFTLAILLFSCKKTGTVPTVQLNEYLQLETGKYIRYRLDSTRFIDFGQRDTVVSYDAKDVIDGELTDGTGKPTYRVVRYLRSLSSNNEADYSPALTYFITPGRESIELSENNLRYQKLRLPVTEGYNWHGNSLLPASPFYEIYEFSNDIDMSVWNYTYQDVNQSVQIGENIYDSTVSILQVADSSNVPIDFSDAYAYKNYWVEQYAKNIGLIYKEVEMWEYQPPSQANPSSYRSGFGLKMTIIDHN